MRKTGGSGTSGAIRRSKLGRVITAPFRMMSKAGNFYVRGMEGLAGKVGNATGGGGGVGGPAVPVTATLPKSFSTRASSDQEREEFRELVRAASRRGGVGVGGGMGMGMRSYSVGVGKIGRIDEDEPCDFEEKPRFGGSNENRNAGLGSRGNLGLYYPRSKSSSITNVGLAR
ncbi:hypothetical protein MLD38_023281 [Melastoma candidum]|uniref:Uncharacterized protein n=1 Tax=Melastoma candidum TaxID=119954 RepID=A0ACB9QV67_9MYRT|nr:hypothetical protein MLD38_023281 [Melastoma candidum]